jgi:hypothetical protein
MVIEEMTERDCRAMLAGTNVARLACARDNQPYIVPIRVDFAGEFLYAYATLGLKIEWMRQNPLVCLEIDELTNPSKWASVVVFGHYEELPHTANHEDSRRVAERLFQKHPSWWEPSSVPLAGHPQRAPIVFRVRIGRVTGRRTAPEAVPTRDGRGNASSAKRSGWADMLRRLVGKP